MDEVFLVVTYSNALALAGVMVFGFMFLWVVFHG